MQVEAQVKTLPYTLAEVHANKLVNTLVDQKAVALIDALHYTLEVETERLGETLSDVKEQALVNTIAYGLAEV